MELGVNGTGVVVGVTCLVVVIVISTGRVVCGMYAVVSELLRVVDISGCAFRGTEGVVLVVCCRVVVWNWLVNGAEEVV